MTERQPDSPAFCWATELAMTQQPVTLSVTEAREVSAEMQRQHAENTALRQGYAAARLEIQSLQARIKTMAEEHADELMVAHLGGRMRAAQPAGAMLEEQAELRRLSDCCPELNLSNYGPDDVDELNGWAIEVSQCIDRALAAQPAEAQQPQPTQAQAGAVPLTDREIELIDGMIQVQLDHASRCDAIANRSMAGKQKGWDMERVALLQKFKAHGIKGGQHGAE